MARVKKFTTRAIIIFTRVAIYRETRQVSKKSRKLLIN